MYPSDQTKDDQLVLQVFPRSDPSRAIVYHGDQEFIREVLRKVAERLQHDLASRAHGDLRLLDEGEEEGDGEGES